MLLIEDVDVMALSLIWVTWHDRGGHTLNLESSQVKIHVPLRVIISGSKIACPLEVLIFNATVRLTVD